MGFFNKKRTDGKTSDNNKTVRRGLIDVIQHNGTKEDIVWKFPYNNISSASQLIVNASQEAIFVRGGIVCDVFGPGTHTLSTSNLPLLDKIVNLPFGGNTPFVAEIWYVNKTIKRGLKFGTPSPIRVIDPMFGSSNVSIPIRAHGDYSIRVERLRDVPHSFETASKAFTKRYFTEENMFIRSSELEEKDTSEDKFDVENLDVKQLDRSKIKEFLKFGDGAETEYFVDEYLAGLGANAIKSQIFRQYLVMDIYFSVVEFAEGLSIDNDEQNLSGYKPDLVRTEEESRNYIVSIINKGIELREGNVSGHNNDVVDSVKKYIEENYADDELSLNQIASHVNFSPNHLSMVFSQQTGNTLIKYLTDFRMNKAKELLKCTNKKSSEISIMVGYKDPHYFSYLFKKTQGVTPTQFREG